MTEIAIRLDAEKVEALVDRFADAVAARLAPEPHASPWLSGAEQAAEYLAWPVGRIYKFVPQLPHYRVGGRLMFRRDELDAWVVSQRVGPPPWAVDAPIPRAAVPDPFHPRAKAHF